MTSIYYANNPHPVEDKIWGEFYKKIHYTNSDSNVIIDESFFKRYWKRVPVNESCIRPERIFMTYNNYETNPLATLEKQNELKKRGINHTSMSVMDIVKIDGRYWIVASVGFRHLIIR